jgi:hypothetical protein
MFKLTLLRLLLTRSKEQYTQLQQLQQTLTVAVVVAAVFYEAVIGAGITSNASRIQSITIARAFTVTLSSLLSLLLCVLL